jgi:dTDP-4-dehydrorhamnose reductase
MPQIKSKILITGVNGQLGTEIRLLEGQYSNFEFIITSRHNMPIEDAEKINEWFVLHQPKYCINCAAYTAVDKAETDRENAYQVNVEGVENLAKACVKYGCKLIHISTDYVFDGLKKTPYSETDATNPINYYGSTKLEGEQQLLQIDKNALIIRTSWVYSSFGNNFVKTMMRLMETKESINVINDQVGSPTYAASLAKAILDIVTIIEKDKIDYNGIFNYSSNTTITWYEFALAIKEEIESKCIVNPIPTSAYPTAAKRSPYSVLDKTKIKNTFDIIFKDWKQELAECINDIQLSESL